jgi:hypothetical protein
MKTTLKIPKVKITIRSIQGKCHRGFKESNAWLIVGTSIPLDYFCIPVHSTGFSSKQNTLATTSRDAR